MLHNFVNRTSPHTSPPRANTFSLGDNGHIGHNLFVPKLDIQATQLHNSRVALKKFYS